MAVFSFFFQAEDGIRDYKVTGVQTCALPISDDDGLELERQGARLALVREQIARDPAAEIGRASCRGKSVDLGGRTSMKKKKRTQQMTKMKRATGESNTKNGS